jgi:hypothetical protein
VADASSAGSAALGALKSMDYRYFVAGGTCAAFSHGITTPIDVVKTKLQAHPEVSLALYCFVLCCIVLCCVAGLSLDAARNGGVLLLLLLS